MTALPSAGTILVLVAVITVVTYALRLAPFVALRRVQDSALVAFLGRVMPMGVMVILVVYTLSHVDVTVAPNGLREAAALGVTIALHLWKRQMLLSIVGGTVCYMLLVQFAF